MDTEVLRSMGLEILRVAPVICGLLLGFRFLFYNEEEWNLDGVYRRLRGGKHWRARLSKGDLIPVNPMFTRVAGILLLGGVILYVPVFYEEEVQALLQWIP
jgi:hypothetical protein